MVKVLHRFLHGIGDAVAFTSILKHLIKHHPDWENDAVSLKGKHSAFFGLVGRSFREDQTQNNLDYDLSFDYDWPECLDTYSDSPSTKACKCLREKFGIQPEWDLLSYSVQVGPEAKARVDDYLKSLPIGEMGYVCIHYEGNTNTWNKNLSHGEAQAICQFIRKYGIVPLILDWDRRSPLPDGKTILCPDADNPLWMGYGTGDAETLAALIERARLFIGIDSGPQKVAMSTQTPEIAIWTRHHPVHYVDRADHVLHLIPKNHADHINGDTDKALAFFPKHYRFVTYQNNLASSTCNQIAKLLGLNVMANPELLKSTAFDRIYYQEHKDAGLDYAAYGDWQKLYGRWLVDALGMKGQTVLDVGCAVGALATGLVEAGALASGIDVNEHTINVGRSKWPGLSLYVCDACNCHYFADNTFHFIHSMQVFEHFNPDHVPLVLKELNRITRQGGVLFIVCDTEELFQRQNRWEASREDPTHRCIKSVAWWKDQIAAAGWREAPDLMQVLKNHPDSYFNHYDWDSFCCRKEE